MKIIIFLLITQLATAQIQSRMWYDSTSKNTYLEQYEKDSVIVKYRFTQTKGCQVLDSGRLGLYIDSWSLPHFINLEKVYNPPKIYFVVCCIKQIIKVERSKDTKLYYITHLDPEGRKCTIILSNDSFIEKERIYEDNYQLLH